MSSSFGIRLQPTTAYHPQANGLVERLHRRLKEALKARLQGPDWCEQLPWVLLSLRITVKEDLECTPADLVYGSALTVPGDCLPSSASPGEQEFVQGLRRTVQNLRPLQTSHPADKPSRRRRCSVPTVTAGHRFCVRQERRIQATTDGSIRGPIRG